ncbi:hypothetical protein [Microbacterium sp.]|uniref:hypothetical protein n=1 Tax=Microbacterium sp. TaxID=51671 RepID=UPI0039E3E165
MTPADQPENPPLTRRRLREMRTQGIPIVFPGTTTPEPVAAEPAAAQPVVEPTGVEPPAEAAEAEVVEAAEVIGEDSAPAEGEGVASADEDEAASVDEDEAEGARVIAADLGAELLAGEAVTAAAPPSFDHLLTRSGPAGGSTTTPNALILSQAPQTGPLLVPVDATGEVIITGSYALPEGYGSTGAAPDADDKETDAALIDEELPLASSPIPVAASAAISTIKAGEEVVAPPVPEKSNKIMMILAITAGVLALGLTGVLILSFVTGVFQ